MTAHTPGPWTVNEGDADPNTSLVQFSCGFVEVNGSRNRREANARLIAAAPDLLEALDGLIATVKHSIISGDWVVDGACDPDMDLGRAEKAIAKALGEA
jgi:hypothetical protein